MVSAISFFALEGCLHLSYRSLLSDGESQIIEGYGSKDSGIHLSFTNRNHRLKGKDLRILADC